MNATHEILETYGDERVNHWLLMRSPIYLLGVLLTYVTVIYRVGPQYMKNRKPFDLKWILAIYNLGQVLACFYLINGILKTNPQVFLFWQCSSVDYGYSETAIGTLNYAYLTFLLKIIELIETIFFVLRKKEKQVSNLHVYHHISTAIFAWIMVKFYAGGMALFSIALNSAVHVIMYLYYFFAIFGKDVQRKLLFIKKKITIIQMIQFCIILSQCVIGVACDVPKLLTLVYLVNISVIFYMFYDFFQKSYNQKKNKVK